MRQRLPVGVFVGLCVTAAYLSVVTAQSEPWVGTWRLNIAKSTYSPGPPPTVKSQTSRREAVPNGVKTTIDTIDAKGNATHVEVTAMFDGKEYEVKGAAMPTTRAYKSIDNRTYEYVTRVNGKVTTTTRSVVSVDGKTHTNTVTGVDAQGQKVNNVVLWERQ